MDENSNRSVSRRAVIKKIGAGAAIVWSAPVLTSLSSSAFAQGTSPICSECPPTHCAGLDSCGEGCVCAPTVTSSCECLFSTGRCVDACSECSTTERCVDLTCSNQCPTSFVGCFPLCGSQGQAGEGPSLTP